jgi:hypothetical protein
METLTFISIVLLGIVIIGARLWFVKIESILKQIINEIDSSRKEYLYYTNFIVDNMNKLYAEIYKCKTKETNEKTDVNP